MRGGFPSLHTDGGNYGGGPEGDTTVRVFTTTAHICLGSVRRRPRATSSSFDLTLTHHARLYALALYQSRRRVLPKEIRFTYMGFWTGLGLIGAATS